MQKSAYIMRYDKSQQQSHCSKNPIATVVRSLLAGSSGDAYAWCRDDKSCTFTASDRGHTILVRGTVLRACYWAGIFLLAALAPASG